MDTPDPKHTNWWITSLAISVVCCAVLFVVFAGYLVDVKENMAVSKLRFDMIEDRLHEMAGDLETLRRHSVQQIQLIPSPAGASLPAPPALLPGPVPISDSPAQAPTATTPEAPVVPAPASPTGVPEVPSKH